MAGIGVGGDPDRPGSEVRGLDGHGDGIGPPWGREAIARRRDADVRPELRRKTSRHRLPAGSFQNGFAEAEHQGGAVAGRAGGVGHGSGDGGRWEEYRVQTSAKVQSERAIWPNA